jgi:hypothetical protein
VSSRSVTVANGWRAGVTYDRITLLVDQELVDQGEPEQVVELLRGYVVNGLRLLRETPK